MNINLPLTGFPFFKVISGSIFLTVTLFFPLAGITYLIMMAIGRAHSFGAWFAMWRAGKLTWKYGGFVLLIACVASFWGTKVATLEMLTFVTYLVFSFHFLFDEFDLQEEKRSGSGMISIISPTILTYLFLFKDFYHLNINVDTFLIIFIVFLIVEIINIKEFNWFFVNTKILSIFIIVSILFKWHAFMVVNMFLLLHYLFWYTYPIYKIYKYKREDLAGFVVMLSFLIFSSVVTSTLFLDMTGITYSHDVIEVALRGFFIGTIIHVFSTAPFGYYIGLSRPKYGIS